MRERKAFTRCCYKRGVSDFYSYQKSNTTSYKWRERRLKNQKTQQKRKKKKIAFISNILISFQANFTLSESSVMTIQTVAHFSIKFHPHQCVTLVPDEQEPAGDGVLYYIPRGTQTHKNTGTASPSSRFPVSTLALDIGLDQQKTRLPTSLYQYHNLSNLQRQRFRHFHI